MITDYATAIVNWDAWQQSYQYGVFLIMPPQPLRAQVNALRAAYDPISQAICDAHISLTIPLPRPMSETDWLELEALVADFAPFPIQYGPLRHYLPYPGVCLAIEPYDLLDQLRIRLESAAIFASAPSRSHAFSPHMTIAEFISVERTESLMYELADVAPSGTFLCSSVAYMVPDPQFRFTERRQLSFS